MAPLLALFAVTCFVNCVLISSWERDVDRVHEQSSLALDSRVAAWIPWAPWLLAFAAGSMALAGSDTRRVVAGCAAASAMLLATVDRLEPRIGWLRVRALADLVLLTPLVALPFMG